MKTPHPTRLTSPAKRSPIAALALMALAVAALAAGCVMGHDPRDDGSRF